MTSPSNIPVNGTQVTRNGDSTKSSPPLTPKAKILPRNFTNGNGHPPENSSMEIAGNGAFTPIKHDLNNTSPPSSHTTAASKTDVIEAMPAVQPPPPYTEHGEHTGEEPVSNSKRDLYVGNL